MDCLKECFRSRWLRVVHPKVNFLSSSLLAVWYLTHGPRSVSHQSQQCHPYPVLYLPLPGRLPLWFRAEVSSWHASHVFLMVLLIKLLRLLIKLINSVDFFSGLLSLTPAPPAPHTQTTRTSPLCPAWRHHTWLALANMSSSIWCPILRRWGLG